MRTPEQTTNAVHAAQTEAHDHAHDGGLQADLATLARHRATRRRWLGLLTAGGVAPLALLACGGGGSDAGTTTTSGSTTTTGGTTTGGSTSSGTCSVIPEETAGPYPGDGSNSVNGSVANALSLSGIVRSDITSSIGGATGTATGVPLTITLTLVNTGNSCASLEGYAIYLWHCDRSGQYSMYSSGITDQNYLRGVQATNASGQVTFTTIVPGCYDGRMPHMHFEVYPSLSTASIASNKIKTSQLTFPMDMLNTVYAQIGYETSVSNLARISYSTDNVFSDGVSTQTTTVSGSVAAGYSATLQVGISV